MVIIKSSLLRHLVASIPVIFVASSLLADEADVKSPTSASAGIEQLAATVEKSLVVIEATQVVQRPIVLDLGHPPAALSVPAHPYER